MLPPSDYIAVNVCFRVRWVVWELETVVGDCHGLGGQQPPPPQYLLYMSPGRLGRGVGATAQK